jgi:hypothetical protein
LACAVDLISSDEVLSHLVMLDSKRYASQAARDEAVRQFEMAERLVCWFAVSVVA